MIKMIFGRHRTNRLQELEAKCELNQAVIKLHDRIEKMLHAEPEPTPPKTHDSKAA